MKTTLITTTIVLLILLQSCGSSKKAGSSSATPEEKYYSRHLTPVVDGKMNEWGETLLYDNSTKCIYALANDDSALYIAIKASDRTQQMKIVQGGMEIWIDGTAKRKKSIGVKFPLGGGSMQMPAGRTSGREQDSKEMAKQMRLQMKLKMLTMELAGFKEDLNGTQSVYSNVPVKPVIEWDDKDNMIYELVIPFAAMDETVRANLHNISIGIFIKGLKMEQGSGGGMPAGGPPGGGMPGGGRPGGGPPGAGMRPGGGGMPDQSEMENMSKDNSFWTKYTIAKN
jgi:hypothetical protein